MIININLEDIKVDGDVFNALQLLKNQVVYPHDLDEAKSFTRSDLTGLFNDCVEVIVFIDGDKNKEYHYQVDACYIPAIVYGEYSIEED